MGYLLAELRYRTGRAFGTLTGVALGVALFIALLAAGEGFREAARQPLAGVGADVLISRPAGQTGATAQTTRGVRQPFGLASLTLAEADALRTVPGVGAVSGGLLLWDFGPNSYQTLLGVDVSEESVGPAQAGEWVVAGRFFKPDERGVAVVDRHYAAFFNLQPGAPIDLGGLAFTVIGIVEVPGGNQAASANFYLPLADAQTLADLSAEQINQIYLRVEEASDVDAVVAASESRLGSISALTEQSIVQVMGGNRPDFGPVRRRGCAGRLAGRAGFDECDAEREHQSAGAGNWRDEGDRLAGGGCDAVICDGGCGA
jgi:ABC-type antimicrobial peptide transport system permease subunit